MASFSIDNSGKLFKVVYDQVGDNTFNSATVLQALIKKRTDFVGKQMNITHRSSFSGGVGASLLPTPNYGALVEPALVRKKVYARVQVDRESVKASATDKGAYLRLMKEAAEQGVLSFSRNVNRILINGGVATGGVLGVANANAGGTAAAPTVVVSAATWNLANFEEKDYINFSTESSVYEITAITPSTRTLTLTRISGSDDLTADASGMSIYMQNSKDAEPYGLKGVLDATSSTLYGVTVGRRWQSPFQSAAGGAGITPDMINDGILTIHNAVGESPDLILVGYTQYRKIMDQLEDHKRYPIVGRNGSVKGQVLFNGVEFMSPDGPVPVVFDRMVDSDRVYLLNTKQIHMVSLGKPEWFNDDGTVFMRDPDSTDSYLATYGCYYQNYIVPTYHGVITGLATT